MNRTRLWLAGAFLVVVALVFGGLGWATHSALRLEREQSVAAAEARFAEKIRRALWRLDGRVTPTLAREDSRPFTHYVALHPPVGALNNDGRWWDAGMVWLPSPLLNAELPLWMRLHFQVDSANGWQSPQVIPQRLVEILNQVPVEPMLGNVGRERERLLLRLAERHPPDEFLAMMASGEPEPEVDPPPANVAVVDPDPAPKQQLATPEPSREYALRSQLQQRGLAEGKNSFQNTSQNYLATNQTYPTEGVGPFARQQPAEVHLGSMSARWLPGEEATLILSRIARVDRVPTYQGIVLDWGQLREVLRAEIADLFPEADLVPDEGGEDSVTTDRLMSALPIRLEPGPMPGPPAVGRTPLRIGLALAWIAATVALTAVGLTGHSLLAHSERRTRFASAVTHELRTPLTTLRLYLDMLTGGMVTDPVRREEYLHTLHAETDRLNRMIANVLDYARLERRPPAALREPVPIGPLLERVRGDWSGRCSAAGKELIVEDRTPPGSRALTDAGLLEQLLGTLIDNAQKHTREAADPRVWLRAVLTDRSIVFEVEDRGPGVSGPTSELFRPFSQGNGTTCGGVGLGLALARRWARSLRGRIDVVRPAGGVGVCFRLEVRSAR